MSRLSWDNPSERYYETGIRQGVLFLKNDNGTYSDGIAWSGLVSITEKFSGGEAIHVYANDAPFMDVYGLDEFSATLEAYTYPDEFSVCEGFYGEYDSSLLFGLQERKRFALCYKTIIGNDVEGENYGYKLHILYDCLAVPSDREFNTINSDFNNTTFSWDITTNGISVPGYNPVPIIVLSTKNGNKGAIDNICSYLYGNENSNSKLLMPNDIRALFETHFLITEKYEPIVFGDSRILT